MGSIRSKFEVSVSPLGQRHEDETDQQGPAKLSQNQKSTMSKQPVNVSPLEKPWRSVDWSDGEKERLLEELNSFRLRKSGVDTIRILLHGPVGAGKSSFFNSVSSTCSPQGRVTTRALSDSQNAGESFTQKPKVYKLKRGETELPVTIIDTRGLQSEDHMKTDDIIELIQGHNKKSDEPKNAEKKEKSLKDKIHCLVSVLPANSISLMMDDVIDQMREVRLKARDFGIPQVVIMTKIDEACRLVTTDIKNVYRSRKIKEKMEECSVKLGVPVSYIYPVKNYHEEQNTNTEIDILILHAILNIVNFAKDYVMDQEDNE